MGGGNALHDWVADNVDIGEASERGVGRIRNVFLTAFCDGGVVTPYVSMVEGSGMDTQEGHD